MRKYGLSGIKAKLVLTYVLALLAPIMLVGGYLTVRLEQMVLEGNRSNASAELAQTANNYQRMVENYESVLDDVLDDYGFTQFVNTRYDKPYQAILTLREQVMPLLRRNRGNSADVIIRLYSGNPTIQFSDETSNTLEELSKEDWYGQGENAGKWMTTRSLRDRANGYYFVNYHVLPGEDGASDSVVAVFFSEDKLYPLIETASGHGRRVFLLDGHNRILSSTERELVFSDASECILDDGRSIADVMADETVRYNGREYFLSRASLKNSSDWQLISMTSTDAQSETTRSIWSVSCWLCAICLLASVAVVARISNGFTGRIDRFLQSIQRIWNDHFEGSVDVTGNDEISEIERGFNKLAHSTYRLIHDVYLANLRAQRAELAQSRLRAENTSAELIALRRQINPHYLFNTIETIRMNLILAGDRRNAHMLRLFAESFREGVASEGEEHTLDEELRLVEKYFEIQMYCHPGELTLRVEASEEARGKMVPRLLLQPLVENAVYHGLEMKGAPGTVRIRAQVEGDMLRAQVSDDGVGMTKEALWELRAQIEGGAPNAVRSTGIALNNLRARLALLYGSAASVEIDSASGAGTTVSVGIPATDHARKEENGCTGR